MYRLNVSKECDGDKVCSVTTTRVDVDKMLEIEDDMSIYLRSVCPLRASPRISVGRS